MPKVSETRLSAQHALTQSPMGIIARLLESMLSFMYFHSQIVISRLNIIPTSVVKLLLMNFVWDSCNSSRKVREASQSSLGTTDLCVGPLNCYFLVSQVNEQ